MKSEMKEEGPGWMRVFYFGSTGPLVGGLHRKMKQEADT